MKNTGSGDCEEGSVLGAVADFLTLGQSLAKFQCYINWISKSTLDNWHD